MTNQTSAQMDFDPGTVILLSDAQRFAAAYRQRDVLVAAGAGSGKTSTLVARYISLLAEGRPPPRVVAITFTEKAAREMRNRCRRAIQALRRQAHDSTGQLFWAGLESRMDSARIGTIHSLCTEILRAHPAEAGIDPEFEVIPEGAGAALRAAHIENVLAWALENESLAPLFRLYSIEQLRKLLNFSLARRLDLDEWLSRSVPIDGTQGVGLALLEFTRSTPVAELLAELQTMQARGMLEADAGEALADQLNGLLAAWEHARLSLEADDKMAGLVEFSGLRKAYMGLQKGKRTSHARELLRSLRGLWDAGPNKYLPDPLDTDLEQVYAQSAPLLHDLFKMAVDGYVQALRTQRALDFDDLEAGALQLLEQFPSVRAHWQAEIDALLVDEFQDTNQRQRRIIDALAGQTPGRRFFVGDDRQSIYRFRGADVTVFRQVHRQLEASDDRVITLDTTYRAHAALLEAAGHLLAPAMQSERSPTPDFWVEYSPLHAFRQASKLPGPYLSFVLGSTRTVAAAGLAAYLLEQHAAGKIRQWDQVALLFRAATHFPEYESALEAAGIPFVTVAGRGFFERPEIRDVLNQLRALANPWDDAAMAGLLRSPAFGLSDSALYRLRWAEPERQPRALFAALHTAASELDEEDRIYAQRAASILDELIEQAERLPVAELLARLVDLTDLRAIYAGSGRRLWQNLDKLLVDAQASRYIKVRDFLTYVDTLRDVGARESEAPVEASGAVQLLTIHKSKGLEFDVVVLADAAYTARTRSEAAYWHDPSGFAARPDILEYQPVSYLYHKALDHTYDQAEEARLLYVALTRAKEKLIFSGYTPAGLANTWLGRLLSAAGCDPKSGLPQSGQTVDLPIGSTHAELVLFDEEPERHTWVGSRPGLAADQHLAAGVALTAPLPMIDAQPSNRDQERFTQRVTPPHPAAGAAHDPASAIPGQTLGRLVHTALQHWVLPGEAPSDQKLDNLLNTAALSAGLLSPAARQAALLQARRLLLRFASHPLRAEIERAGLRYHEIPYLLARGARIDGGAVDLLYRAARGWRLLDFKSEPIQPPDGVAAAVDRYRGQIRRYVAALSQLLSEPVSGALVFLDVRGDIQVVDLADWPG